MKENGLERADELVRITVEYVDGIFGPGMGRRHLRFLERLENSALRQLILSYHAIEGDSRWLSLEENYLLGMCTLCATRDFATAAMFAKTLMHLGVDKRKILEAAGRLSMWIGGLPAAEASFVVQKAIHEYEAGGISSMAVWFPEVSG